MVPSSVPLTGRARPCSSSSSRTPSSTSWSYMPWPMKWKTWNASVRNSSRSALSVACSSQRSSTRPASTRPLSARSRFARSRAPSSGAASLGLLIIPRMRSGGSIVSGRRCRGRSRVAHDGRHDGDRQEVRLVVEELPGEVHELRRVGERERHAEAVPAAVRVGHRALVDVANAVLEQRPEQPAAEDPCVLRLRRLHAPVRLPAPARAQDEVLDLEAPERELEPPRRLSARRRHVHAVRAVGRLEADSQFVVGAGVDGHACS